MNIYGSETSAPFISLTPSEDTKEQVMQSRMRNSVGGFNGEMNGIGNGGQGVKNSTPPLMAGVDSISISPSPTSNSMDIPSGNGGKRLRSGSLFSTNSIWNDDGVGQPSSQRNSAVLDTSSIHSFDTLNKSTSNSNNGGNYLSPLLTAQNNNSTINNSVPASNSGIHRNRSYTTTAAIPNTNIFSVDNGAYNLMDNVNQSRLISSPSVAPSSKGSDISSVLDNIMTINNNNNTNTNNNNNNGNSNAAPRFRSQTFSGSTPAILDSSIQQGLLNHSNFPQQGLPPQGLQALGNINSNQFGQNSQHFLGSVQQEQPGSAVQPVLQDDFNYSKLMITTNFENPSLGPTNNILFDNLPQFMNAIKLWSILNNSLGAQRALGTIRAVKVSNSTSPKLAIVECSSIDIAMALKANFNHLELVPGVVIYAAFAKFTENQPQHTDSKVTKPSSESTKPGPTDIFSIQNALLTTVHKLSQGSSIDFQKLLSLVNKSISYPNDKYQDNFGPLPDPIPLRQFDSMKLRELRNVLEKMENGSSTQSQKNNSSSEEEIVPLSQLELEEMCISMLNELPELCYDYLGNTIVQKLFTFLKSPFIKLLMVKEIAPYLTQLSIHKNGTWAIQKIMNLCENDYQQMKIIGESLKPYAPKLFNDQFGNYVLQCCTKFGPPFNDFIFEAIIDNFIEISSGRFGARCIRTILESASDGKNISREQEMLVAGLIVEFANELVLNSNGSLLITWFLDSFNSKSTAADERFRLLTDKLLPRLDHLCTHKLANLTILKILNNRIDPQSKQRILDAIFGTFEDSEVDEQKPPSQLLEHILAESSENASGPLFVQKILSNPLLFGSSNTASPNRSSRYQKFVISQVKRTLLETNFNNIQPYKKLMEEVGIPTSRLNRSSSVGRKIRRSSRHKVQLSQQQAQQMPPASTASYLPNMYLSQSQYPPSMTTQMMMQNQQPPSMPQQQASYYQQQPDQVLMQQLEQLSLSSVALGYNSNPGTPGESSSQKKSFF